MASLRGGYFGLFYQWGQRDTEPRTRLWRESVADADGQSSCPLLCSAHQHSWLPSNFALCYQIWRNAPMAFPVAVAGVEEGHT